MEDVVFVDKNVEEVYIQWQKEFVNGFQNKVISYNGMHIDDECKTHYWNKDEVYNLIGPFVNKLIKLGCKDDLLYGKNKIVDRLIPYQKRYNKIENKVMEVIDSIVSPIVCVEDGSMDVDELCEEGLAPGKVIVYRQGSKAPSILLSDSNHEVNLLNEMMRVRDCYKKELVDLMEDIENELILNKEI